MLLNPYHVTSLQVVPGTRMLQEHLGLAGYQLIDTDDYNRVWTVQGLYTPVGRKLGGVRIKLVDNKGFITFCNQRDFEVLIGMARPGDWCLWANQEYAGLGQDEWFGFCMDTLDLCDDFHERELELLGEYNHGGVADWCSVNIERRLHLEKRSDVEDYWIPSLSPTEGSIYNKWIRVHRNRVEWKKLM
jgi:hypothetical protein